MARTKSLADMLTDLHNYQFHQGFPNEFADDFTTSLWDKYQSHKDTTRFTEKQAAKIEELHMRYCT